MCPPRSSSFSLLSSLSPPCLFRSSLFLASALAVLLSLSFSLSPFPQSRSGAPVLLCGPHAYLPVYLRALYVSIHAHQSTSDLCRGYEFNRALCSRRSDLSAHGSSTCALSLSLSFSLSLVDLLVLRSSVTSVVQSLFLFRYSPPPVECPPWTIEFLLLS